MTRWNRGFRCVAPAALAVVLMSGVVRAQSADDLVRDLRWRNIGPGNMMGRIASIDALDTDHRVVLVAAASGGVFLSRNAGTSWSPIFDNADGAGSIGAAVFYQGDPDVIWVGTGEAANRNSSGWGDGVWRTTDGGETWQHLGLADTHHIAEIATHPTDPDIAYVASPGHLWGYSGDRGLWKTTDGGASWQKLTVGLPDDGRTGVTEIIMDPENPELLYAGFYHRLRQPATMNSGGEAGGMFKSEDGGATWRRLTGGLPAVTGMIDIAIHRADPDIVVAAVEAEDDIPFLDEPESTGEPGGGIYISEDRGETWRWSLKTVVRPFYHGQVDIDPLDPDRIYSVGREFSVTRDGGETWGRKWWGGGGDDHDFWIAPYDGSIFYMATDQGAYLTQDDGETILAFNNMAIGQYYKIGVDMRDPYWVIGGLQDNAIWMGPSNSREVRGVLNLHHTWLAEGDGFASWIDPTDWRTAYVVNHVGFAARMNVETRDYQYITPTPETVVNFDDYFDPGYDEQRIRYTIDPGEHWFFREQAQRPLLPPQFRFNWNAPFLISPNNPSTVYFAGNHLFKSVDRGDSWRIISPDLTRNDPVLRNPSESGGLTRSVTGGENHFTIFAIAESPLNDAVVWAGTDDGNVQLTRNGGATWTNTRGNIPGIPDDIWVGKIEASSHAECRAYVTFDNHRLDDFQAYLYRTDDCGASWTDATGDLPDGGGSYVTLEDPVNPDVLYMGTEFAVYATVDGGVHWARLANNMPKVATRDLVLHAREADLVAGTHGRSIWILDDLTPLRQTTAEVRASGSWLYAPKRATTWARINLGRKQEDFMFRGENPPYGALLNYWLGDGPVGEVSLHVEDLLAERRAEVSLRPGGRGRRGGGPGGRGGGPRGQAGGGPHSGINRAVWNLSFPSTENDRRTMAERLSGAIAHLVSRVDSDELRTQLTQLGTTLDGVDLPEPGADRGLNEVRAQLVAGFGAYAGGEELFGARIGSRVAEPGTYRVVLTVDGSRFERELVVRDDPLRDDSR